MGGPDRRGRVVGGDRLRRRLLGDLQRGIDVTPADTTVPRASTATPSSSVDPDHQPDQPAVLRRRPRTRRFQHALRRNPAAWAATPPISPTAPRHSCGPPPTPRQTADRGSSSRRHPSLDRPQRYQRSSAAPTSSSRRIPSPANRGCRSPRMATAWRSPPSDGQIGNSCAWSIRCSSATRRSSSTMPSSPPTTSSSSTPTRRPCSTGFRWHGSATPPVCRRLRQELHDHRGWILSGESRDGHPLRHGRPDAVHDRGLPGVIGSRPPTHG